jgi:tRNA dimethylallyltransferase
MVESLVVAVVGPTAAGKSDLSVALCKRLTGPDDATGEVVNADAMQVYRGMDVGTAKITAAEQESIPHHLLDILDVTQTATVAEFQQLARAAIDDCLRRQVVPVLAGGSALYVRAILDDFEFPGTDAAVRERLEAELEEHGSGALHQKLTVADPAAAEQIHPSNGRRIVRALEVIELTGAPYAATLPEHTYIYPGAVQLGLDVPRPVLDERIGRRVDRMFEQGFVDEVKDLLGKGLLAGRTANRARILPGDRVAAGRDLGTGGAGANRPADSPVRPATGFLVPQGSTDHLASLRCTRSAGTRCCRSTRQPIGVARRSRGGRGRCRCEGVTVRPSSVSTSSRTAAD